MNTFIAEAAQGILAGGAGADHGIAKRLAQTAIGHDIYDLLYWANRIRLARVGPEIKLCAIAAGKVGACSEDCAFCGQSVRYYASFPDKRAAMSATEIMAAAYKALEVGASSFGIVNSGRGPTDAELDLLAPIFRRLADLGGLTICASLGILSDAQARRLYELGVRRYNHNLETSRRFFPRVITSHSFDERLATTKAVKRAGISLCCGGIFGLGETMEDRLDFAQTLAAVCPDEIPLNFLHALEGTPLANAVPMEPLDILRTIALFRFILPEVPIKVAGGREANLRDLQSWIFFAGASGCIMGNYLLTSGRSVRDDRQMFADLQLLIKTQKAALPDEVKA